MYDTLVFLFSILICMNPSFVILDKLSIFFLMIIIFYSTMPNFKRNLKILMEGNLRRRQSRSNLKRATSQRSRS